MAGQRPFWKHPKSLDWIAWSHIYTHIYVVKSGLKFQSFGRQCWSGAFSPDSTQRQVNGWRSRVVVVGQRSASNHPPITLKPIFFKSFAQHKIWPYIRPVLSLQPSSHYLWTNGLWLGWKMRSKIVNFEILFFHQFSTKFIKLWEMMYINPKNNSIKSIYQISYKKYF